MKAFRHLSFRLFATLFILLAATAAFADDDDDPPARVARLKYISGEVSIQPGGVDDWVAATINRPLTTADKVWTDRDGRAELHMGTSVMRLNSETSMGITNLTDETVQVAIYQGTLNLTIKRMYSGEIYEIDTPNVVFTITKTGEYRFDVNSHTDATYITVRKGEGVATGDGPAVKVKKNKTAVFRGKGLDYNVQNAGPRDGFDEWSKVRDDREKYVVAGRYVSPDVIGYEDLDHHGSWSVAVGYGNVWFPRVSVGWAPYRHGHWAWVHPWGWTWVDHHPWGFAPFHYGRWVNYRGRWGWCPGPIRVRPYYAPALVAWVGGPNFSVGVSFGGGHRVGWFPLGYGEPYIPHRRVSRRYFQQVNVTNTRITNVTNITNIYNNVYTDNSVTNIDNSVTNIDRRRRDGHGHGGERDIRIHNNNIRYANLQVNDAVTGISQHDLVRGKHVDKVRVNVDRKELDERQIARGPQVAPSRESVLGNNRDRQAARPRTEVVKPVREKMTAPRRASFEERKQAIEREVGRPEIRENSEHGRSAEAQRPTGDNGTQNGRVPRPSRVTRNGVDSSTADRKTPERIGADSANQNAQGRSSQVETPGEAGRDLPARVPRPPRRVRDAEPTSSGKAADRGQQLPSTETRSLDDNRRSAREEHVAQPPSGSGSENRETRISPPRPPQRNGMGNGENNGRGSGEDRAIGSPRSAEVPPSQDAPTPSPRPRQRDWERETPKPARNSAPVDRGSNVESRPSVDQPQSRPMPAPRQEERVAPPPRVETPRSAPRAEAPRSEPRTERAPRSEPRPQTSAPRQEAPRASEQRPQSNGGGNNGRSGGSEERRGGKKSE
jgi:hypothetical protein